MNRPTTRKTQSKATRSSSRRSAKTTPATTNSEPTKERLTEQFRSLRLPMFRDQFQTLADRAAAEKLSHVQYLAELTELECQARHESRIKRLMTNSRLPLGKTWETFKFDRLPLSVTRQLESLREGSFLDRRENVLVFGRPGAGKSHVLCALANQLVQQGRSMLLTTCSLLVQQLLIAKRDDVDPVGACVGMRGSRVQAVVQELRGEKIDIVPWNPDPVKYVCSGLAPAQVVRVIVDDEQRLMDVILPDDQLSLAIGKKGQNVRLAVQLTGWKIDIKSESYMREVQDELAEALAVVPGLGEYEAKVLLDHGIASLTDLAEAEAELLTTLPGISEEGAGAIKSRAAELAVEKKAAAEVAAALAAEQAAAERLAAEQAAAEPPAAEPPEAEAPADAPTPGKEA